MRLSQLHQSLNDLGFKVLSILEELNGRGSPNRNVFAFGFIHWVCTSKKNCTQGRIFILLRAIIQKGFIVQWEARCCHWNNYSLSGTPVVLKIGHYILYCYQQTELGKAHHFIHIILDRIKIFYKFLFLHSNYFCDFLENKSHAKINCHRNKILHFHPMLDISMNTIPYTVR